MLVNEQLNGTDQYGEERQIGGAGPSSGGGFFSSGGGTGSRFMTHEEARQQILGIQPQGQQGAPQGGGQGPGIGYGNLQGIRQPLGKQNQQIGQSIRDTARAFGDKVGGAPSYDPTALQNAINPGTDAGVQAEGTRSAKAQLDPTYAGPQSIDPQQIAAIASQIGEYGQRARSLQTGGGLQNEIQSRTPGTRPGEAMFEAERIQRETPDYRNQLMGDVQQAAAYQNQLRQEQARANELVALRKEQEKQVAEQATGYLKEQKQSVYDRLQGEVDAKNAEQAKILAAYDSAVADPTKENLAAIDPYAEADASKFQDPLALPNEAKAAYVDIMRRYAEAFPEIAAYPPLQRIVTGRGETWYGIPNADGTITDIRKIKGMSQQTQRNLVARQKELERLFEPQGPKSKAKTPEGKYANVAPLYYGDNTQDPALNVYEPPKVSDYLTLSSGNTATVEMLASSNDRTLVDNVNALLNESDRLMETGEVFQAASIAADVEKYLNDADQQLNARAGQLDEADKAFSNAVKKARHRHKRAKARSIAKDVTSILMGYYGGDQVGPLKGASNAAGSVFGDPSTKIMA